MVVRIRDVAQRAGVSVGTVSNVLNRPAEVSPESVERVSRAIEELGYVRNDAARQLRAGISTTVGFVVLNSQNPFYNDVVRGAQDEAAGQGIAILYGDADEDVARQKLYLDLFQQQQVRGVLLAPYGDVLADLRRLRRSGIATVLVDRFSADSEFSSVSLDSVAGGRLAMNHLIETGRKRVAFVGGPFQLRQVSDRLAGARAAAEDVDVPIGLEVVPTEGMLLEDGLAAGARILERPRRQRPDALIAANDLIAIGLMQALIADGRLLVPHEMALIGFDDIPFAAAAAVPLTSIRQPGRQIGRTALRTVLEEVEDPTSLPRQTVFPPELVVRRSTAG
ncbi:MAG TPA: LacI family transcriptional regulator [Candidatus Microbacterium stercoravium]|uniref:LacI family transcriptional regulator n=1 Tax=Candidatus Microbacterium stercoravium TaxID=2838697 RepID=A0A9D2H5N3_9MICO|nr:LacI family transcriptional regulator [Candidatus Microbacterium stercoravium]